MFDCLIDFPRTNMIKARKACFVMQDYLLNCWEETPFVVPIANEEIVAVSWLQSSGMVFIYLFTYFCLRCLWLFCSYLYFVHS